MISKAISGHAMWAAKNTLHKFCIYYKSHDMDSLIWLTGITRIDSGMLESSQKSQDSSRQQSFRILQPSVLYGVQPISKL